MIQHHSIKAIIQISLSMFIDEVLSSDLLMTTHTNSTHPSNSVIWHLNPLATSDHLITIQLHYSPRVFCMTYSLTTPYLQPEHHGKLPQTARISKLEKGMKPKSTVPEKVLKTDQIRPYSHIIFKLSSKERVLKIGQIGHYSHRQQLRLFLSTSASNFLSITGQRQSLLRY